MPDNAGCCDVEDRPEAENSIVIAFLEAASGIAVGCGADNRRALAFRTVRSLRRSNRESADSRKEFYAIATPLGLARCVSPDGAQLARNHAAAALARDIEHIRQLPPSTGFRRPFFHRLYRVVRRDCTFLLQNRFYEAPPHLAGETVEARFDPLDPALVEIFFQGESAGTARLVDALVNGQLPSIKPAKAADPEPTGIDFVDLLVKKKKRGGAAMVEALFGFKKTRSAITPTRSSSLHRKRGIRLRRAFSSWSIITALAC